MQPEAAWVRSHIVTETLPLLGQADLQQVHDAAAAGRDDRDPGRWGSGREIKYHVGCYYPRFIAGSTTLSNHSFGLAIDINSLENQRGTVGQMHPVVVEIMKKWGFAWGGDWNYTDPMHFELRSSRINGPRPDPRLDTRTVTARLSTLCHDRRHDAGELSNWVRAPVRCAGSRSSRSPASGRARTPARSWPTSAPT